MKQSIVFGFGLLSTVFMLSACDSSSGGSSVSGFNYSGVVNETAQTITIYSPTCKLVNDVAVFNAQGDTSVMSYSISNDTLTMGETYFTGNTSGSVYGTWNFDFLQLNYSTEDVLGVDFPDSLVSSTLTVSESGLAIDVDMSQICYADYIVSSLADEYEGVGVVITKNNCNKITLASEDGSASMTASFSISYGKSVITLSMSGKSCSETVLNSQVSASNCTADNLSSGAIDEDGMIYSYDNVDEFETCEEDFGTEESKVLAKLGSKTSVAAKALAKKIVKERK
ncbi:MAG: hypothetical protein WCR04_03465 [Fibrobacteraceae bacterium]